MAPVGKAVRAHLLCDKLRTNQQTLLFLANLTGNVQDEWACASWKWSLTGQRKTNMVLFIIVIQKKKCVYSSLCQLLFALWRASVHMICESWVLGVEKPRTVTCLSHPFQLEVLLVPNLHFALFVFFFSRMIILFLGVLFLRFEPKMWWLEYCQIFFQLFWTLVKSH